MACFDLISSAKQDGENADDHKVFDFVFYFINNSLKLNTKNRILVADIISVNDSIL